MIKKISVLFLLVLLSTNIVLAQTDNEIIQSKTDSIVDKEIEIPENLQTITKIFFKIEKTLSVSAFIILIVLWIISLLILTEIIDLLPFVQSKWMAFAVTFFVVLLMSLTGIFNSFMNFFLNVGSIFKFLENWSVGVLIFIIVVLVVGAFILIKILKFVKEYSEISEAHQEGREVGVAVGFMKSMKEWFKFTKSAK